MGLLTAKGPSLWHPMSLNVREITAAAIQYCMVCSAGFWIVNIISILYFFAETSDGLIETNLGSFITFNQKFENCKLRDISNILIIP